MSDYGVGWPLWDADAAMDPAAVELSEGLTARLHDWQGFFEERFHHERGWQSTGDAAAYAAQGRQLRHLLETEIGGWARVELDLWPVTAE